MCVYADCDKADAMYVTTDKWKRHIKDCHSTPHWICDTCWLESENPGKFEFEREEECHSHIVIKHTGQFEESDSPALAEASQRTVVPPVACPLCYENRRPLQPDIDKHIAEHLHSFALQALPSETIGPGSDTKASVGSDAGKPVPLAGGEETAEEIDWGESDDLPHLIDTSITQCTNLSMKEGVARESTLTATLADLAQTLHNLSRRYSAFSSDVNDEIAACLANLESIFLRPTGSDDGPIDAGSIGSLGVDIAQGLTSLNALVELAESKLNGTRVSNTEEVDTLTPAFSTSQKPTRLDKATSKSLSDLQTTDPDLDMKRIEDSTDPLLKDCYEWILDDPILQE